MNSVVETFRKLEKGFQDIDYKVVKTQFNINKFIELVEKSKFFKIIPCHEGKFSEVKQDTNMGPDNKDHSHQSTDFTLHVDGPYRKKPPKYVVLYCENGGIGKASTFLSSVNEAVKSLGKKEIEILMDLDFVYLDKNGDEFPLPLLEKDKRTGEYLNNYSGRGYVRPNKFSISSEMIEYVPVVNKYIKALSKSEVFRCVLKNNDLFIFDNRKYMHGRSSKGLDYDRHLYRIWVDLK